MVNQLINRFSCLLLDILEFMDLDSGRDFVVQGTGDVVKEVFYRILVLPFLWYPMVMCSITFLSQEVYGINQILVLFCLSDCVPVIKLVLK